MKFRCRTLFDITTTGVTGHYKSSRVPFQDRANNNITNEANWNRARNQQRNYETLVQLISMRVQIFNLTESVENNNEWSFEFEIETPDGFGNSDNPTENLEVDGDGVPMLTGLNNRPQIGEMLITDGPNQNIWFDTIPINNVLEN